MIYSSKDSRVKFALVFPAIFAIGCIFYFATFYGFRRPRSIPSLPAPPTSAYEVAANPFAQLYHSIKPDIAQATWTDSLGYEYRLKKEPLFWNSIGRHIAIVDVDSRDMPVLDMYEPSMKTWKDVDTHSVGVLNHYLYAKIHGYDYKFIQMPSIADRHDTWLKVAGIAQVLGDYQFVVFLDNDATFTNLELPMEWMLNYWNVHENMTLAVAKTPKFHHDALGKRMANTGFMVAQNTPLTHKILKRWAACPDEQHYEGCAKYKDDFPHEQGAFSDFIRHDKKFKKSIKLLKCDEVNGMSDDPEVQPKHCGGKFVKHWWGEKDAVKWSVNQSILRNMIQLLQGQLGRSIDSIVEYHEHNLME